MAKQLKDKVILGIDPGTNVMGYGVIHITGNVAKLIAMGVIDLRREGDIYLRLGKIFQRVTGIIDSFLPDEMAIESPFFGKNVQSMLKLGRAQGVAMAAAINHGIPITEYAPLKIKMAITGRGSSSKEQVALMLQKLLAISEKDMPQFLDATDALGAAYCHYLQLVSPIPNRATDTTTVKCKNKKSSSWKEFIAKNSDRVTE